MSFPSDDFRHAPPPPAVVNGGDPLTNLSIVQTRMDNLHKYLAESVNAQTLLSQNQIDSVNAEISSAIHQVILNAAALLSPPPPIPHTVQRQIPVNPNQNPVQKTEDEIFSDDTDIVEIDAVELLAEHVHFCDVCGKGFKRDANLRMHMRAHGNQFKTVEALTKPGKGVVTDDDGSLGKGRITRFSCPYVGCNRNKTHKKFRPLKSVVCVKNHFKRSHCPKMYSCNRCNKKSFSVVADLKSHLKHCGESKWKCSCGTSFSRKDKLFGHVSLFEGHMPAVVIVGDDERCTNGVDEEQRSSKIRENDDDDDDDGFFDGLDNNGFGFSLEGMNCIDSYGMSSSLNGANMEEFFQF